MDAGTGRSSVIGQATASSRQNEVYLAMLSARWFYRNLYVLAECVQKIHQPLDREVARLSTHQTRNVRLSDAQYLSGGRLRKSAIFDKPVNLQREAGP